MNVFAKPCAMLRNVYIGLWVLLAGLYWLAGPDFAYRRSRAGRAVAIARCRERLYASGVATQAELDMLEAEDAAAASRFAEERARFLERLRARGGLDTFDCK
jgi:hypothetical protein